MDGAYRLTAPKAVGQHRWILGISGSDANAYPGASVMTYVHERCLWAGYVFVFQNLLQFSILLGSRGWLAASGGVYSDQGCSRVLGC